MMINMTMAAASSSSSYVCFSSAAPPLLPRRKFTVAAVAKPSAATPSPPATTTTTTTTTSLPLRKIPGDYGLPLLGPLRDRFAYFYTEGRDDYLRSRSNLHRSTVLRLNVPPGPPIAADPRVVALLDAASFPTLFDTELVEKKDLFTGTFMPSVDLTGGYRTLSYLDPSEPSHAPLKKLLFHLLTSRHRHVIPEFRRTFGDMFDSLEAGISAGGAADFGEASDKAAFDFLCRSLLGTDPADTELGSDGPKLVMKWVLFQLGPILTVGLPRLVEDVLLHSVRLPPALVRKDYGRLADFFRRASGPVLDEADRLNISREEAVHNILFSVCFNAFGGMKILFPSLVKWVGRAGARLHGRLAEEVRSAVRSGGGEVTMRSMESMPLLKSAVYECLRIEPPVPLQFGRAKKDFVLSSHDARYEIRAGEMLFGYQPFATKDARVFDRPEEFVADRFVGEGGEALLKHVVWSNGPETQAPTVSNKQCAGKDFVVLVARMLLAELFLRYDSFDIEVGKSALGSSVKLTSLKRASF
ncbi:putative allene oxide synthase 1, chloroplastic [Iris pallida]|uniref:Allene oxide synthase 1, chloroplastic n=1 Tax=Iris pallida TaxID=29817 RepID=A0AAX6HV70_IRIPA|nr:putative allene oxide synthase 1, chloroplastic [Iris pallida]